MREWLTVFVTAIAALIIIGWIAWIGSTPARGEWVTTVQVENNACDYPESLIIDALATEPNRLVKKLEGKELESFLSKMQSAGYLSGSLPSVTIIYIISGKLLPGHHEPIDILFFIDGQGCIVGKVYGSSVYVRALLP